MFILLNNTYINMAMIMNVEVLENGMSVNVTYQDSPIAVTDKAEMGRLMRALSEVR